MILKRPRRNVEVADEVACDQLAFSGGLVSVTNSRQISLVITVYRFKNIMTRPVSLLRLQLFLLYASLIEIAFCRI